MPLVLGLEPRLWGCKPLADIMTVMLKCLSGYKQNISYN